MHDVSVIGPLNIDILIHGDGPPSWEAIPTWDGPAQMEMTAAGSIGYTVTNLARLGLSVAASSCLSDDPLGAFILDSLQRAGVDTQFVERVPQTQGGIGIYMLLFGSRKRPLVYRMPTHPQWKLELSPTEQVALLDAKVLHCGGYLHYQEAWHGKTIELFKQAQAQGLLTSVDPQFPLFAMQPPWKTGMEDLLPHIDLLFCDEHEARQITGLESLAEAADYFLCQGVKTAVIKQGDKGATVYQKDWQYHQPAVTLGALVDSIGAGDMFDTGFLYGTLQGWSLEKRALFAAVAAGFSVTGVGGSNSAPALEVILAETEKRFH